MALKDRSDLSDRELSLLSLEIGRRGKSLVLAYLLFFFVGGLGIHKFYVGNTKWGIAYLVLTLLGFITLPVYIGILFLLAVGVLCIIDLFTLPRQVERANEEAETSVIREIRQNRAAQE